jgi:hypothetical protein
MLDDESLIVKIGNTKNQIAPIQLVALTKCADANWQQSHRIVIAASRSSLLPWFPITTSDDSKEGLFIVSVYLGCLFLAKEGAMGTWRREELAGVTTADPYERALIDRPEPAEQPILTVGLLIFSLAFCALVFEAGLRKEVAAYEKCGLDSVANCRAIVANPPSTP